MCLLWTCGRYFHLEVRTGIVIDWSRHNITADLQAIGEPRYALQKDVVDLYKTEVGASEPQEDYYDRHYLYGV